MADYGFTDFTKDGVAFSIAFKEELIYVIEQNELNRLYSPYELHWAGSAKSGWSYGVVQYDLGPKGSPFGRETFVEVLLNAKDSAGNFIIDDGDPNTGRGTWGNIQDKKVKDLYAKAQTLGGRGFADDNDKRLIKRALESTYGMDHIDKSYDSYLNYELFPQKVIPVINSATGTDRGFLTTDLGMIMITDFSNQFGTVNINLLKKFVAGQTVTTQHGGAIIKQGVLGLDDLLNFAFRTNYASNYPWDLMRRYKNVVAQTDYTPASIDEAKGVLRAYTYLYVRNESILTGNKNYLNSVNAFRSAVTGPAEQMILDNWQSAWGPRPASINDYHDMLMGDDTANSNVSGDYILRGSYGDIIFGEGGNDTIEGSAGHDTLIGGQGNGSLLGGWADDTLIGSEGNDTLIGGLNNDLLMGGENNDTYIIYAGDGTDTIEDKQGNNKVILCGKVLNFFYDKGNYQYTNADGTITAAMQGTDLVVTHVDSGTQVILNEDFQWGDFGINLLDMPTDPTTALTLSGDLTPLNDPYHYDVLGNIIVDPNTPAPGRNDTLFGSAGNDRIEGKGGSDIVYGQGGNDWVLGGTGRDGLSTGDGSDIIEGGTEGDLIFGGAGDDQIFGENKDDMDDLVTAGEEATNINEQGDLVSGQAGNDFIYGSDRNDALFGGSGSDLLVGGGGNDIIMSGNNADSALFTWSYTTQENGVIAPVFSGVGIDGNGVYDETGNDAIYAGTGNDFVYGAGGDDEVYAGNGNDTVFGWGGSDNLFGEDGDDVIIGDNDATVLAIDKHGDDYIDGGAGNDLVFGYGGNDQIYGGDGNDEIYGGDESLAAGYTDNDYIDGGAGDDLIWGGAGDDLIWGGAGDDSIYGGDGNDLLNGEAGNDYLDGETGVNTLLGGAGNDTLYGGDGDNNLQGDDGDDYLEGGTGNETILGGAGNDTIYGGEGRKDSVERIAWSVEKKGKAKLQGIFLSVSHSPLYSRKLFLTTDYLKNYTEAYFTTDPSYAGGSSEATSSLHAHKEQHETYSAEVNGKMELQDIVLSANRLSACIAQAGSALYANYEGGGTCQ